MECSVDYTLNQQTNKQSCNKDNNDEWRHELISNIQHSISSINETPPAQCVTIATHLTAGPHALWRLWDSLLVQQIQLEILLQTKNGYLSYLWDDINTE